MGEIFQKLNPVSVLCLCWNFFKGKILSLTWNNSRILILLHVSFLAAMSQRVLIVLPHSVVELHLRWQMIGFHFRSKINCIENKYLQNKFELYCIYISGSNQGTSPQHYYLHTKKFMFNFGKIILWHFTKENSCKIFNDWQNCREFTVQNSAAVFVFKIYTATLSK